MSGILIERLKRTRSLSARRFWILISSTIRENFIFRIDYHRWLWSRDQREQDIVIAYSEGFNQFEIAARLRIARSTVAMSLKKSQKDLTEHIIKNRLLED